jgi:hypothetical protein
VLSHYGHVHLCLATETSYSTESSGVPHRLISHTEENDTPITWAHPTTGGRLNSLEENDAPTTRDDSTLTQRRTMPHHMDMLNTGLSHRSTQFSHKGERIQENVSQCYNHQQNFVNIDCQYNAKIKDQTLENNQD